MKVINTAIGDHAGKIESTIARLARVQSDLRRAQRTGMLPETDLVSIRNQLTAALAILPNL